MKGKWKADAEKRRRALRLGRLRHWGRRVGRILAPLVVEILWAIPAWPQQPPADLTKVNIEDLMNIDVTSVSKKDQKLSQVASAIFVITQEDIRRSGATNIPDLLRMVPGMEVAR